MSDQPTATASTPAGSRAGQVWQRAWPPLALAGLLLGSALTLRYGGWPALAAALPLSTWAAWQLRKGPATPVATPGAAVSTNADETRLALQLVPVWKRNVEAARSHSERSMEQLLESFANVSDHLDQALSNGPSGSTLQLGAADELLERHRAEIDQLLASSRSALRLKDDMQALLRAVGEELADMTTLTREVQNIGRATHLLALNASVEATRAGSANGGFAVVAQEVRALAGQSRDAGQRLSRRLLGLRDRLATLQTEVRREDVDDEALTLRTEQAARAVVLALLGSVAEVSRASRDLQQAGRQVQSDLERIFVGLQSQDRLSQMLDTVSVDMLRYSAWLRGADDPAAASPQQWLARLEASYTMEEMRSSHHGNKAIAQETSVEFF